MSRTNGLRLRLASTVGILLGCFGVIGLFVWMDSYPLVTTGLPSGHPVESLRFNPRVYALEFLVALGLLILVSSIGLFYSFKATRNKTAFQTMQR